MANDLLSSTIGAGGSIADFLKNPSGPRVQNSAALVAGLTPVIPGAAFLAQYLNQQPSGLVAAVPASGDARYTNATPAVSGYIRPQDAPTTFGKVTLPAPLADASATGKTMTPLTPGQLLAQQYGVAPEAVSAANTPGVFRVNTTDANGKIVPTFTNVIPEAGAANPFAKGGGFVFGGASSPSGGVLSGGGAGVNTSNGYGGINFGPTGATATPGQITPPQTPDALTTSVNSLIGQALGMANTQPSGSDSFVDFFQKAATRKRGQEALASLANTAGQLAAKRASEADTNALQAQRYNQEYATELLRSQIGNQAAMAKAQMEAPKIQAETAKAQAEAQNLLLGQQAKAAFLKNPTPENAAILQSLITGQAVPPQKPTVTKVITPTGADNLVITSPTGRILAQGSPEVVQAQQNLQPGQAHLLANGQVLFLDPTTGQARQGTAAEYNAAYAKR